MAVTRRGRERRGAQRVRLVQALPGTETATGVDVRLRDLSREAFAVETPVPFVVGNVLEFTFNTPDGVPLTLHGKVKRCEQSRAITGAGRYRAGFSFAWKNPSDRSSAQSQIRSLTRNVF
jgi:hypothetical protein